MAKNTERGYIYLEDGDYETANEFFEKALDENPKDGKAYFGKVLVNYCAKDVDDLVNKVKFEFEKDGDYIRALKYADESFIKDIENRIVNKKEAFYKLFVDVIDNPSDKQELIKARDFLRDLNFKDSLEQADKADDYLNGLHDKTIIRLEKRRKEIEFAKDRLSCTSRHVVGVKSDGTVLAKGNNEYGQCNVGVMKDVKKDFTSYGSTVALTKNGKILFAGDTGKYQSGLNKWKHLKYLDVDKFDSSVIGIQENNTAVSSGFKESIAYTIENDWKDLVQICQSVGVKSDGTIVMTPVNQERYPEAQKWRDIVEVAMFGTTLVGLKLDGTVVYETSKSNNYTSAGYYIGTDSNNYRFLKNWTDVVSIKAGSNHIVGLKSDGTVVADGIAKDKDNYCNVKEWNNVIAICAGSDFTAGLKEDGVVVAIGRNDYGQTDVVKWKLFDDMSQEQDRFYNKSENEEPFINEKTVKEKPLEHSAGHSSSINKPTGMISVSEIYPEQTSLVDSAWGIPVIYSSYDGVTIHWRNTSYKTYNYVTFYLVAMDKTGKAYLKTLGQTELATLKLVGPIKPGEFCKSKSDGFWMNGMAESVLIRGVKIECEDGTNVVYEIQNYHKTYNDFYREVGIGDRVKTAKLGASSNSCYVATCVYGSYDCPEVWTLRRFRDTELSRTWFGKSFIHLYYSVSPTIVKWFGKTKWFTALFKPILNRMVQNLQKKGFASTPYTDKSF